MMSKFLFCTFMVYAVWGCMPHQPQEVIHLAAKSLNELQSVSAVKVSNAAYNGTEFSDKLATKMPFLFKKVVRDTASCIFTFEKVGDRVFYRNDQPYSTVVYPDLLLGMRVPVSSDDKRYDYFARIEEELAAMQEVLDGKRPKDVSPDSSRIAEQWVERAADTLFNGRDCYVLKRHDDVILVPERSDDQRWKANVNYKVMHSYNTYALFIEKKTGFPLYWSYTNMSDKDGKRSLGNRNKIFLENIQLADIPDSCFYPSEPDKIRYVASFDEFLQKVEVGDEAPGYKLTDVITGKVYTNESLKGKVIVLQFTSAGCVFCILSQPGMNKLYAQWKDHPEVFFMCAGLLNEDEAKNQVEEYKFAYPMAVCDQTFFWAFGVQAVPAYFVIGKDNRVLAKPETWVELRDFLNTYFNK